MSFSAKDPTMIGRRKKRNNGYSNQRNNNSSYDDMGGSLGRLKKDVNSHYDAVQTPPKNSKSTKPKGKRIVPGLSFMGVDKRKKGRPRMISGKVTSVREINESNSSSSRQSQRAEGDHLDVAISRQTDSGDRGGRKTRSSSNYPMIASIENKRSLKRKCKLNSKLNSLSPLDKFYKRNGTGNTVDLLDDDDERLAHTQLENDHSYSSPVSAPNNKATTCKHPGEELEFQCDLFEDDNDGHSLVMDDVLHTPCNKNHDSISKKKKKKNDLNYGTPTDNMSPCKKKKLWSPGMDVSLCSIKGVVPTGRLGLSKHNNSNEKCTGVMRLNDDHHRNKPRSNDNFDRDYNFVDKKSDQEGNDHSYDDIESVSSSTLAKRANERMKSQHNTEPSCSDRWGGTPEKHSKVKHAKSTRKQSYKVTERQGGCSSGNIADFPKNEENLASLIRRDRDKQSLKGNRKKYGNSVVTIIKSKKSQKQKKGNSITHPTSRRSTRPDYPRKKLKPLSEPSVILIDSSDDSDDSDDNNGIDNDMNDMNSDEIVEDHSPIPDSSPITTRMATRSQPIAGARKFVDAVRIAIGGTVFSASCVLEFQPSTHKQFLLLKYRLKDNFGSTNKRNTGITDINHKIDVSSDNRSSDTAITEIKYFIASDIDEEEDEETARVSFIALRVSPNDENGLIKIDKYLSDDEVKEDESTPTGETRLQRRYIVIEVRKKDQFTMFLEAMRKNNVLNPFMDCAEINTPAETSRYTVALEQARREEKNAKEMCLLKSIKRRRQAARLSKNNGNNQQPLLVYPFHAPPEIFKAASETLTIASGPDYNSFSKDDVTTVAVVTEDLDKKEDSSSTVMGRTHLLTIHEEDADRLEPGEFLNDTLIDFWMRWISRGEDVKTTDVHFFTTQFFSKLANDGPSAVASWTAKKNINIFKKKFIFIPVNDSLHWSLCIVVNAGKIENAYEYLQDQLDEQREHDGPYLDKDAPFILFLDSLRAHKKALVHKKVIKWLDSEAQRLGTFPNRKNPFTRKKNHPHVMPIHDPPVPYQDNSWDCGVFVCRYAYSTLLLRYQNFTFNDITGDEILQEKITKKSEFNFCMEDIKDLRDEIKELVSNLSKDYRRIKAQESEHRRKAKMAVKSKPSSGSGVVSTTAEFKPTIREDNSTLSGALTEDQDQRNSLILDSDATVEKIENRHTSGMDCISLMADGNAETGSHVQPIIEKEDSSSMEMTKGQELVSRDNPNNLKDSTSCDENGAAVASPITEEYDRCDGNAESGSRRLPLVQEDDTHFEPVNVIKGQKFIPTDNLNNLKDSTSCDGKVVAVASPTTQEDDPCEQEYKSNDKIMTEGDVEEIPPEINILDPNTHNDQVDYDPVKRLPTNKTLVKLEEVDQFDDAEQQTEIEPDDQFKDSEQIEV